MPNVIDANDFMVAYRANVQEEREEQEAYLLGYALGSGEITMEQVRKWSPRVPLPPPTAISGRIQPKRDPDEAPTDFWRKVI